MDRQSCTAFLSYIQKAFAIVPTTGAEWNAMQKVLMVVDHVAQGIIEVKIEPVGMAAPAPAPTPAPSGHVAAPIFEKAFEPVPDQEPVPDALANGVETVIHNRRRRPAERE